MVHFTVVNLNLIIMSRLFRSVDLKLDVLDWKECRLILATPADF